MNKVVFPVVVSAALAVSSLALASETTTGTITSINSKMHTITLDNGETYQLPQGFKDPALKERENVTVTWNMYDNERVVHNVKIDGYDMTY